MAAPYLITLQEAQDLSGIDDLTSQEVAAAERMICLLPALKWNAERDETSGYRIDFTDVDAWRVNEFKNAVAFQCRKIRRVGGLDGGFFGEYHPDRISLPGATIEQKQRYIDRESWEALRHGGWLELAKPRRIGRRGPKDDTYNPGELGWDDYRDAGREI